MCLKYEYYKDENIGLGIKFQTSSYEEINKLALSRKDPTINILLDSTFGYYTLDLKHKFVLAHYNWHKFADRKLSKGIVDSKANIKNIEDTLNRRIERMHDLINKSEYILGIYFNNQNYKYMMIDDIIYSLEDFDSLINLLNKLFPSKKVIFRAIRKPKEDFNEIFKAIV
ncbi:hypothetical protein C5441_07765 [Campylobacter coli]|nr:hypothetical protein [Campylobacter coli]